MGLRQRMDRLETLLQAAHSKISPEDAFQVIEGDGEDAPEEWAAKIAERETALVEKYGTAEGVLFVCVRKRFGLKPALDEGLRGAS